MKVTINVSNLSIYAGFLMVVIGSILGFFSQLIYNNHMLMLAFILLITGLGLFIFGHETMPKESENIIESKKEPSL